jgi:hypothetical protein
MWPEDGVQLLHERCCAVVGKPEPRQRRDVTNVVD